MDAIPNEIWVDIFKRYFNWDQHNPTFISPTHDYHFYKGTPFCISYVCSKWRKIVLGDQSLWSSIAVGGGWDTLVHMNAGLIWPNPQRIKLWFERSGSHRPLSICFDLQTLKNHQASEDLNVMRCLDLFISYTPRWKHVLLDVPDDSLPIDLPLENIGRASLLQYLEARHRIGIGDSVFVTYPWLLHIVQSAPLLQMLFFTNSSVSGDDAVLLSQMAHFRLGQLCHLRVDCFPPLDAAVDILRSCTNLISCSIIRCRSASARYTPRLPVTLPYLRYLRLGASVEFRQNNEPWLAPIINEITTPALTNLTMNNDLDWDATAFDHLILRSNCLLQHLIFHNVTMSSRNVVECLQNNPSLVGFRGGYARVYDESGNHQLLNALQDYNDVTNQWSLGPFIEDLVLDSAHLMVGAGTLANTFVTAMRTRLSSHPSKNRLRRIGFVYQNSPFSGWAFKPHSDFVPEAIQALGEIKPALTIVDRPPAETEEWFHAHSWIADLRGPC